MDTWWIDQPLLRGSSNPTDRDVEALHGEGFRILVSLLQEHDQPPNYDPEKALALGYKRFSIPVRDFHAPSVAQLVEFIGIVRSAPQGAHVLVHCQGGIGRTGTFAAAYWIAKGLLVSDAIARVRQARPGAVEAREQEARLHEFAAIVHAIELLADGLALICHEARNVRHLIQARAIPATGWDRLVALPKKRGDAWKEVQALRMAARRCSTATECAHVFEKRFGWTILDLRNLFANPNWKYAKGYGGNAWLGITALLLSLQDAIAQGEEKSIQRAAQSLVAAKHNNGTLRDKISGLDQAVGATTADWWEAAN